MASKKYLLEEITALKKIVECLNENIVPCAKSKLLIRKSDAYKVTVQGESYGVSGFSYSLGYWHDGISYEYYSPLYAPDYDYVDATGRERKYYKTVQSVPEHQVEVKAPKK